MFGNNLTVGSACVLVSILSAQASMPSKSQKLLKVDALVEEVEHNPTVFRLALSGDGKWLVAGGVEGDVVLWEVATGKKVRSYLGHTDRITEVFITKDGKSVITASYDKTARLWELATGKEIRRFTGHTSGISSASLSRDDSQLLTGSGDSTVRRWDVATGKLLRVYDIPENKRAASGVLSVAFLNDDKWLATHSGDGPHLWEVETGKEVHKFEGVGPVPLTDGKWVAIVKRIHYEDTKKDTFLHTFWDVASGELAGQITGKFRVLFIAPEVDGRRWVGEAGTWAGDSNARLWDLKTGKGPREFKGHLRNITCMTMSRDGKWLVTGSRDGTARIWDVASTNQIRVFGKAFPPGQQKDK